jgi:hypothetical protein
MAMRLRVVGRIGQIGVALSLSLRERGDGHERDGDQDESSFHASSSY